MSFFSPTGLPSQAPAGEKASGSPGYGELVRPWRHPISRWYLLPAAAWAARRMALWGVPPWKLTGLNLFFGLAGAWAAAEGHGWMAAGMWWAAWTCDRLDGALARASHRCSPRGALLDAATDELVDLTAHAALAAWAATEHSSWWPWVLWAVFATSKWIPELWANPSPKNSLPPVGSGQRWWEKLRAFYHLLGNADLRWHLVLLGAIARWPLFLLVFAAGYFAARAGWRLWKQRRQRAPVCGKSQPKLPEKTSIHAPATLAD